MNRELFKPYDLFKKEPCTKTSYMTTETLSMIGNSLRPRSLDVQVDIRCLPRTAMNRSSRPIVKYKRYKSNVKLRKQQNNLRGDQN